MSDKNSDAHKRDIYFPVYINQGRLLDLYAILNDGYLEFSEISTSVITNKSNDERVNDNNVGFKMISIGESEQTETNSKQKKVQTVSSILSNVLNDLKADGYLKSIENAQAGGYVCIPVNLKINSVKSLLEEVSVLIKLVSSVDSTKKTSVNNNDLQGLETIRKQIKPLFGGDEVVFESDSWAIVGSISENNLYQSVKEDLIGIELKCFAQVKRVFPDGAELMRNTVFSRIKDHKSKENFIQKLNSVCDKEIYDFNTDAISSISDKPVYQLEIIALYQ